MKSGMHMVSSYCGEMLSVLLLSVISSRGTVPPETMDPLGCGKDECDRN